MERKREGGGDMDYDKICTGKTFDSQMRALVQAGELTNSSEVTAGRTRVLVTIILVTRIPMTLVH